MELQFYPSQFNYFAKTDKGVLGYNARTGIFALLSVEMSEKLKSQHPIEGSVAVKRLQKMGFVHQGNEIDKIRSRFIKDKAREHSLHVTIIPSLKCNYSCSYCYQKESEKKEVMSLTTQEAILGYIQRIAQIGYNNISFTWYGGEPLLFKNIILRMGDRLKTIVTNSSMSIVTNGTLLTSGTAEELSRIGIKNAQISFDSLLEYKNEKRGVLDSSGRPSKLLQNIINARKFMRIKIRINVTKNNVSELPQIFKVLDKYDFNGSYYVAEVINYLDDSIYRKNLLPCPDVSKSDFFRIQKILLKSPESVPWIIGRLTPRSSFCAATQRTMLVFDPKGNISRCWHSAMNPLESIGNVNDNPEWNDSEVEKLWSDYSPFKFEKCNNCKVLPLCMGGCPHNRLFINKNSSLCPINQKIVQLCIDTVAKNLVFSDFQITPA